MSEDLRSVWGNGGSHEAGAVGLARGDVQKTSSGTGNLTGTVVAIASTLLHDASHGDGGEGKNNSGLHFCGDGLLVES